MQAHGRVKENAIRRSANKKLHPHSACLRLTAGGRASPFSGHHLVILFAYLTWFQPDGGLRRGGPFYLN
jgi:hypothetical protein